jgi:hypothetical protein
MGLEPNCLSFADLVLRRPGTCVELTGIEPAQMSRCFKPALYQLSYSSKMCVRMDLNHQPTG